MRKIPLDKRLSRSRPTFGFTLVELVVAIVLLGILTSIAVPSIVRSLSAHSVDREARHIHSWLATARAKAIAEQRQYKFELNADGSYDIKHFNGASWVVDGGSEVGDGITITISGASSGDIVFQPHGQVDALDTIVIHDGRSERWIRVMASGLVAWRSLRH